MSHLERFVAIGDIHTEDETLERVLAYATTLRVDAVLAVGDVTFLNPGTLYRGQQPGLMLVDLTRGEARFFDADGTIREAQVLGVPV